MAEVQVEDGFTRIANALLEAACRAEMPGRHLRVVLAIVRLTYGFNRKADWLGSTQLSNATGIGDEHVRSALRDLIRWNVVVVIEQRSGNRRCIGVQKDFDLWEIGRTAEADRRQPGRETARAGDGPTTGRETARAEGGPGVAPPEREEARQPGRETAHPSGGRPPDSKDSSPKTSKDTSEEEVPAFAGRTRTDPSAWSRMFDAPDAAEWVASVLSQIEGEADAAFPNAEPTDRAWTGKVRSLLHRYWKRRGDFEGRARAAARDPRQMDPDELERQALALIRGGRDGDGRAGGGVAPADVRGVQPALLPGTAGDVRRGHRQP